MVEIAANRLTEIADDLGVKVLHLVTVLRQTYQLPTRSGDRRRHRVGEQCPNSEPQSQQLPAGHLEGQNRCSKQVIVEEGDVRKMVDGREYIVQPKFDEGVSEYLRPLFEQYYTLCFDNYPVELERVEGADIRECGAT